MHWASQYIGRRWVSGARGPAEFDCWGLVRWVFANHYGIELPEFVGVDANDHKAVLAFMRAQEEVRAQVWADWQEVPVPRDGDAVAMGGREFLNHVGIYIAAPEGSGVLHCRLNSGVIFQRLTDLKAANGFRRIIFYRHALHC